MLKKLTILTVLFTNLTFSQVFFEKGYIVQNNVKKECLINFTNPKTNPGEISYKFTEDGEVLIANLANTSEFGVENKFKFVKRDFLFDKSINSTNSLSFSPEPENEIKTAFLRVLVDGNAALLKYETSNNTRYYIEINGITEQLIYKKYLVDNTIIKENDFYKRQLAKYLNCGVEKKDIDRTSYYTENLSKLFIKHNSCVGNDVINYASKVKQMKFNLHPKIGVQNSKMDISHSTGFMYTDRYSTNFNAQTNVKFGLEFEVVFPFHDYRISVFSDPMFQSYEAEGENKLGNRVELNYKSIEVPIGFRYFVYNGTTSKVFANTGFVFDVPMNSYVQYSIQNSLLSNRFELENGLNFFIGLGYRFNDKISIELRHSTARDNLSTTNVSGKYSGTGLLLSYNIF